MLERRVAALERAEFSSYGMVLLVKFMAPGRLAEEISHLDGDTGESWDRLPGESQEALIDRATSEARRSPFGVVLLFATA